MSSTSILLGPNRFDDATHRTFVEASPRRDFFKSEAVVPQLEHFDFERAAPCRQLRHPIGCLHRLAGRRIARWHLKRDLATPLADVQPLFARQIVFRRSGQAAVLFLHLISNHAAQESAEMIGILKIVSIVVHEKALPDGLYEVEGIKLCS
jgi:hypothetical protein